MSKKISGILEYLKTSTEKITSTMINTAGLNIEMGGSMTSHILPAVNNTYDIGSAEFKIRDMYVDDNTIYMGDEATIKAEGTSIVVQDLKTGDLHLDNTKRDGNSVDGTKGSWTFQEGSDDLFLLNNVTGKKYKFNLTEI